jgi:multiple sugar transport system permease protein
VAKRSFFDPSEAVLARILLAPAFLLLALVVVYPVGRLIFTSFQELALSSGTAPHFVGFQNYRDVWNDPVFWIALTNTVVIAIVTVPGALVVGMGLALVANMSVRVLWPVRLALLVPWALPLAFVGLIFAWFFQSQYGVVNDILRHFRTEPIIWFNSGTLSMAVVCLTIIWKTSSFVALILLAGLQTIAPDYYEAAEVDGASRLRQF